MSSGDLKHSSHNVAFIFLQEQEFHEVEFKIK